MTGTVVLAVGAAAFLIGLAKGGLAGFGPIVTVVVALAVPATVAIGILLPLLMIGDVVALAALRHHVDRSTVGAMIPGALVGVVAATAVLASLSAEALEIGIVAVVIIFVVYRTAVLLGRMPTPTPGSILTGSAAGVAVGVTAGVTSTVAHAGGPPVAVYLLARRLPPLTYAGTSAAFFWATNWMKVPGYALAGLLDPDLMLTLSPTVLLILPGVLCGRWAVGRLNAHTFEIFVLIGLLTGSGLLLVT